MIHTLGISAFIYQTDVNTYMLLQRFVALKIVADGKCLLKPISDSEEDHIPGLDSDPSESDQVICYKAFF